MGIQWPFRHFIASAMPKVPDFAETKLLSTSAYYHLAQKKPCIRPKQPAPEHAVASAAQRLRRVLGMFSN
jgi:hypothetical protein